MSELTKLQKDLRNVLLYTHSHTVAMLMPE